MKCNPFNHNYFVGYISEVSANIVKIHFPSSILLNKFLHSGEEFNSGLVGDFVAIEGENHGFLGRIIELSLPENERLNLNEKAFQREDFHPTGKLEILLSFDYFDPLKSSKGLDRFPNIGAKVYVCNTEFIQLYLESFGVKEPTCNSTPVFNLGKLTSNKQTNVNVSQQSVFSRHCAVVGTTGGGKSWTVAKLMEETALCHGKAIIIDATGEYHKFDNEKFVLSTILSEKSFFHYSSLTFDDLFYLLKPAGKVQAPKLMEAVRSLKMVQLSQKQSANPLINYIDDGFLLKSGKPKREIQKFYYKNIKDIEDGFLTFDIEKLARQITNECIWDTDRANSENFGNIAETDVANCISLISRINHITNTALFKDIFGFTEKKNSDKNLTNIINKFLNGNENILRIGFDKVSYDFQAREILANSIAKHLLQKARNGLFKNKPLVFFVDEAHQYLNKSIQDEYFAANPLDAFNQIAKECRKYGLFLCLATQMPRDIPIGTLSQMGTFIVHRLINFLDKEAIGNACSSANKNILSFLPVLGEGEAILTGIDFPMPLSIKINVPEIKPDSQTPLFNQSLSKK